MTFHLIENPLRTDKYWKVYDYKVTTDKPHTVESFLEELLSDPANRAARGGLHFLELQTHERLYLCSSALLGDRSHCASYQMGEIYAGHPVHPKYLTREIQKIEADGYGLGEYNPAISYHLLLAPKYDPRFYQRENGQMSLFRE